MSSPIIEEKLYQQEEQEIRGQDLDQKPFNVQKMALKT